MQNNFQQAWAEIQKYMQTGIYRPETIHAIEIMNELNKRFTVLYIDRADITDRFGLDAEKTFTDGMMQAVADEMFKNEYLLDEFYADTLNFAMDVLHNVDPIPDEEDLLDD